MAKLLIFSIIVLALLFDNVQCHPLRGLDEEDPSSVSEESERLVRLFGGLNVAARPKDPPVHPEFKEMFDEILAAPDPPPPNGNHKQLGERISMDAELLGEELVRNAALIVADIIQQARLFQLKIEVEAARMVAQIQSSAKELTDDTETLVVAREGK